MPTPSLLDYQVLVLLYNLNSEAINAIEKKNAFLILQKKEAFIKFIEAIDDEQITPQCFYLDVPRGSGKTYLYNIL